MSGRVIFFPTTFRPDHETMKTLNYFQKEFELYHAELAYLSRDWDKWQKMIYKERSHNNVRKSWKIIKGEKN
jgi:hypothetical protein